ncbi:hypothetical protein [Komagataeibacter medellinensis]|uniref:hypothetical protein n=1 Tax=Komagataeibacter medellinensis TaxID=1177712 RepID=UPI0003A62D99|nr:hypothetical protein [Komagataeibacter medellinensis]
MMAGLLLYYRTTTGPDGMATFDLDSVLLVMGRYDEISTIPDWLAPKHTLPRINTTACAGKMKRMLNPSRMIKVC